MGAKETPDVILMEGSKKCKTFLVRRVFGEQISHVSVNIRDCQGFGKPMVARIIRWSEPMASWACNLVGMSVLEVSMWSKMSPGT